VSEYKENRLRVQTIRQGQLMNKALNKDNQWETGGYFKGYSAPTHTAPSWVMSDRDLTGIHPDFTSTDW
jgi:hypothetical protein